MKNTISRSSCPADRHSVERDRGDPFHRPQHHQRVGHVETRGWTVEDVDLVNWTITVKSPESYSDADNDVVENGNLILTGYTAAGTTTKATSYLSLSNREVDLTEEYSNSYVITPARHPATPSTSRTRESRRRPYRPANVAVLWQSAKDLVNFSSFDAASGTFTFFISHKDTDDDNDDATVSKVPRRQRRHSRVRRR